MTARIDSSKLVRRLLCSASLIFTCISIGCDRNASLTSVGPVELYEEGLNLVAVYDLSSGREVLEQAYLASDEGLEIHDRIVYALAITLWHESPVRKDSIERAKNLLSALARDADDVELRRQSMIDLGRLLEVSDFVGDLSEIESARELYRKASSSIEDDVIGSKAKLFLANSYFKNFEDESSLREGVRILEEQLDRFPDCAFNSILWQTLGDAYSFNFSDSESALRAYQEAEKIGFADESVVGRYLWKMGQWAEDVGDEDELVRIYTSIVVDTPRSSYGTLARERIEELANLYPERNYVVPQLQSFSSVSKPANRGGSY